MSKGLADKAFETRKVETLDDVLITAEEAMKSHSVAGEPYSLTFQYHPLESEWLNYGLRDWKGSDTNELLKRSDAVLSELKSDLSRYAYSPIDKVVLQRDITHVHYCLSRIISNEQERKARLEVCKEVIKLLLLSETEKAALRREYSLRLEADAERLGATEILAELGIPDSGDSKGVYEFRFADEENMHFVKYGGRSRIRVFLDAKGVSSKFIDSYWRFVYEELGGDILAIPRNQFWLLPEGSKSYLVRTFLALDSSLEVFDSGIIEELLIRQFKYQKMQLDSASDDFKGTIMKQYKMRRELLTTSRGTGLEKIGSGEVVFTGLFADAPDLSTAHKAAATQMRLTCIDCHGFAAYSTGSVHSFGRKPAEFGATTKRYGGRSYLESVAEGIRRIKH